jgi:hypothetical protein
MRFAEVLTGQVTRLQGQFQGRRIVALPIELHDLLMQAGYVPLGLLWRGLARLLRRRAGPASQYDTKDHQYTNDSSLRHRTLLLPRRPEGYS